MRPAVDRNRQLIRQWRILRLLEDRGRTLDELAASADVGVTTRTIRRDLFALEAAGFPIYVDIDDEEIRRWQLLTKGVTPARRAA
jgi:predicted DNA-binding transcriptional regulator YafY